MKLGLFALIVWLALIIGWVMNIYKLVAHDDFESPYKAEVLRTVGVFVAPLGLVLGYITFDEEEPTKVVVVTQ